MVGFEATVPTAQPPSDGIIAFLHSAAREKPIHMPASRLLGRFALFGLRVLCHRVTLKGAFSDQEQLV